MAGVSVVTVLARAERLHGERDGSTEHAAGSRARYRFNPIMRGVLGVYSAVTRCVIASYILKS